MLRCRTVAADRRRGTNLNLTSTRMWTVLSVFVVIALGNASGIMSSRPQNPRIEWRDSEDCGDLDKGELKKDFVLSFRNKTVILCIFLDKYFFYSDWHGST